MTSGGNLKLSLKNSRFHHLRKVCEGRTEKSYAVLKLREWQGQWQEWQICHLEVNLPLSEFHYFEVPGGSTISKTS